MEMEKNAKTAINTIDESRDHNTSHFDNIEPSSSNDKYIGNDAEMEKNAKIAPNIMDETQNHITSHSDNAAILSSNDKYIGNDAEMEKNAKSTNIISFDLPNHNRVSLCGILSIPTTHNTIGNTLEMEKTQKTYSCDICKFITTNHFDHMRHLNTRKHINKTTNVEPQKKIESVYVCDVCNKSYHAHSGLWKHKKTCIAKTEEKEGELKNVLTPSNVTPEIFMEIIRQNKDLQELIREDRKIIMELIHKNNQGNTNSHNTTTNSNNSFNLNFFLNEQCKNALNIYDFVDSLKPTFQDMERTGKLGFVEGITGIFLNGLRELDIYSRPIHCTDLKRESLYVKDNDIWEKEPDDKPRLRKAIKRTANKNLKQIRVWEEQHPDYVDTDTQASEDHIVLAQKLLGGVSQYETEKFENTIIKNVLRGVTIDKEALTV